MRARIIIAACLAAVCGLVLAQSEWDFGIGQKDQVTKGLVAYWAMRNSGTTVYDEIGTNNGTAVNSPTFAYSNSVVGNSVNLDTNLSQYINCGGPASLNITGAVSVSVWMRVTATNVFQAILISSDSGFTPWALSYSLYARTTIGAMIAFRQNTGSTDYSGFFGTLIPNTWMHVVGVFDGASVAGYIDGASQSVTSASMSVERGFEAAWIGRSKLSQPYFNGRLDELRIYNRAITADEVKQLYRMGAIPRGLK